MVVLTGEKFCFGIAHFWMTPKNTPTTFFDPMERGDLRFQGGIILLHSISGILLHSFGGVCVFV